MEELQDPRAMTVAAQVAGPTPVQATNTEVDNLFKSDIVDLNRSNDKQSIVDSKTIGPKVAKCIKAIQKDDTSAAGKIKIADFVCNKMGDYYFLSLEKREIISDQLTKVVYTEENMPNPLRLFYLRFIKEEVPYDVSQKAYKMGIREKMAVVPYFQILKYILRCSLRTDEIVRDVLNEFEELFVNEEVSIYTKMDIADIFLLNNREPRGEEMLGILRELEFNMQMATNDANNVFRHQRMTTVYQDSQNVHGTDINTSVLTSCVRLMELNPPGGFDYQQVTDILVNLSPTHRKEIETVVERIQIDTTRFKRDRNLFSLYDVFSSLWVYINAHQAKDAIMDRLIEEIVLMSKYCTTGHVGRFINVIQGFTDDEQLQVRISDAEQMKSVVSYYLDQVMSTASDDITMSMIGPTQQPFYDFITEKMNERIPKLVEEYGDVQEHIIAAVRHYSQWSYWSLMDIILTCDPKPPPMIEIFDECHETYPCKHYCVLDGEKSLWGGMAIHKWFVENGKEVPEHFREYSADFFGRINSRSC